MHLIDSRAGLCDILRNHTYVGMADETLAIVQHQTKLYLVNGHQLSRDLFYQQVSGRSVLHPAPAAPSEGV